MIGVNLLGPCVFVRVRVSAPACMHAIHTCPTSSRVRVWVYRLSPHPATPHPPPAHISLPNLLRSLPAIHDWHIAVHQDNIVLPRVRDVHRLLAIFHRLHREPRALHVVCVFVRACVRARACLLEQSRVYDCSRIVPISIGRQYLLGLYPASPRPLPSKSPASSAWPQEDGDLPSGPPRSTPAPPLCCPCAAPAPRPALLCSLHPLGS